MEMNNDPSPVGTTGVTRGFSPEREKERKETHMAQLVEIPTSSSFAPFPRTLLRDRVAIVTGASRGIGRAVAIRLAEAGAHVIVNYLQRDREAEEVLSTLRSLGAITLAVKGDIADVAVAAQLIDITLQEFGPIDVLVANPAIWEGPYD